MSLAVIVAVAENGVIGRGNALPWHLPDDLKRFKSLTMGHPIIMGRRTFESIGRPLPGRDNVVLSRTPGFAPPGVVVLPDLPAAMAAFGSKGPFVIGGAGLFREALAVADTLHLTRIHQVFEGDVFFPDVPWHDEFDIVAEEPHPEAPIPHTFVTARRRA